MTRTYCLAVIVALGLFPAVVAAQSTSLHGAAAAGDLPTVNRLIATRADVNAKATNSRTALMLTSGNGHGAVVTALLAARADVNAKTTEGVTALDLAEAQGHGEIVKALKAAGAK